MFIVIQKILAIFFVVCGHYDSINIKQLKTAGGLKLLSQGVLFAKLPCHATLLLTKLHFSSFSDILVDDIMGAIF